MKSLNFSGIASCTSMPCITISMNTNTSVNEPDNHYTELSRLADQARLLVLEKTDTPEGTCVLEKLKSLPDRVPVDQESESISIFLSETLKEILYSPWPVPRNRVQVGDRFDLRPLIEISNNYCEYDLLVLHYKGVRLLHAKNHKVTGEVKNSVFPVTTGLEFLRPSKMPSITEGQKELFDQLDEQLIARFNKTKVRYVIAASKNIHANYIATARFHSLYLAHITFAGGLSHHALATAAWTELLYIKDKERHHMVDMVAQLAAEGKALTEIHEILAAARGGRGDVLVIDWGKKLTEEEDAVYCEIIWHVIKHKGRVVMAKTSELGSMGSIALKLCY